MSPTILRKIAQPLLRIVVVVGLFIGAAWFVLTQPTCSSQPLASHSANANRLRDHVAILAVDFHPRSFNNLENLNRCADYIAEQFKEAGGRVVEQNFPANGAKYRNVSAYFARKMAHAGSWEHITMPIVIPPGLTTMPVVWLAY